MCMSTAQLPPNLYNLCLSQHEGVHVPIPQLVWYRHCTAGATYPPSCQHLSLLVLLCLYGRKTLGGDLREILDPRS
jgi:hypothetical protein